jgi:endonuclease YncB( thermonuclease family)
MRLHPVRPRVSPGSASRLEERLACIFAAFTIALGPKLAAIAQTDFVDRVVDGDTIIARSLGRARLIGVNSPETVAPAQMQGAPAQCFGPEASRRLKELLPTGTRVRLETDISPTDKFGRSLVYVYREPDDLFINGALVEGGYARAKAYKPNVQYAGLLDSLQRDAEQKHRGLWGACASDVKPAAKRLATTIADRPAVSPTAASAAVASTALSAAKPEPRPTAVLTDASPAVNPELSVPGGRPANPGDTKNCKDFPTYAEAKAWFDTYFPYYGDVAKLDGNSDGIPCEALRGQKVG